MCDSRHRVMAGDRRLPRPGAARQRSLPRPDGRRARVRLPDDFSVERCALCGACVRGPATAAPLSPAAQDTEALGHRQRRLAQREPSFATALVATLDAEIGTRRATRRPSRSTHAISRKRMGLSEREQELAHLCGLVHDVGKIGLAAGLLEKPGAIPRGAATDGAALRHRRAHSQER